MASQSLTKGFVGIMANWLKSYTALFYVLATLLWVGVVGLSQPAQAFSPKPFHLELEGFFYRGIPIQVRGTQTLEQRADGSWRMILSARGPFVRLTERSDFLWQSGQLVPLQYHYELNAPFEHETRSIQFDASGNEIRAHLNDQQFVHPYDATWLDPLSYTLLLKRDLLAGADSSEFVLFDRSRPRTYRFERIRHRYAPQNSIVMSQITPDHGDIFIVFSAESLLPAHLLRWNDGRINYQIKTLQGQYDGLYWYDFPHWPTPRRFNP